MSSLNRCCFIGNLTKEPEIKTVPSGKKVASFTIAVNEKHKDKESVEFIKIVIWDKLAEIVEKYIHKGSKIYIEGKLVTRSWDKPDGTKAYMTEIVGDNMVMLGGGQKVESNDEHWVAPVQQYTNFTEDLPF